MPIYPEKLPAALAAGLKPLYLIAGEEPLLIEEALDQIRASARQQGFDERQTLNHERGFDWGRLLDAGASASLFSSRQIVELNMGEATPGVDGGKAIRALAERPSEDHLVILRAARMDGRARSSAWVKALEKVGCFVYVWPMKHAQLPRWISQRLREAGLIADDSAIQLLAERTEGNLLAAAQDIEKLKLLVDGGRVGVEQVREAVADSARFDVFEWTDRILLGDAAGAARGLQRLRQEGIEPILISWALSQALRNWSQMAADVEQTGSVEAAMRKAYIPRPRQGPFERALQRAGQAKVLGWLWRANAIDGLVKTGQGERAWEELLTCALLASGQRGPRSSPPPNRRAA